MRTLVPILLAAIFLSGCGDRAVEIAQLHSFDGHVTVKDEVARLASATGNVSWESFHAEGMPSRTRIVSAMMTNQSGTAGIQWLVNTETSFVELHAIMIDGQPRNLITGPLELETWSIKALTQRISKAAERTSADTDIFAAYASAEPGNPVEAPSDWMAAMDSRMQQYIADAEFRGDFLKTLHSESTRAGLNPQLVLALAERVSGFKKYAVSDAGAIGFMQIQPRWIQEIGRVEHNLFHLRTNLRYGCTILRHYVDDEHGNVSRALLRYMYDMSGKEFSQPTDEDSQFLQDFRGGLMSRWAWKSRSGAV
jgi:hypothetical protein